jgi:hypothetical protein
LIWYTLHGPEDTANLKPLLVNPEVILVLVAPKAAERAREELSELCEKVKKPMVRLSIGYAPSAVTNAIVNQAGEQILATIERPLSPAKSPFSTSSLRPGMGLRRPSSFGQNLDFDEED